MKRNQLARKTLILISKWDEKKRILENAKALKFHGISQAYNFARFHGLKYKRINKRSSGLNLSPKDTRLKSIKELSKENGVSYSVMGCYIRNNNLPFIKHKEASVNRENTKKVIKFLRDNGFGFPQIGKLYGVSKQRIQQVSIR